MVLSTICVLAVERRTRLLGTQELYKGERRRGFLGRGPSMSKGMEVDSRVLERRADAQVAQECSAPHPGPGRLGKILLAVGNE